MNSHLELPFEGDLYLLDASRYYPFSLTFNVRDGWTYSSVRNFCSSLFDGHYRVSPFYANPCSTDVSGWKVDVNRS